MKQPIVTAIPSMPRLYSPKEIMATRLEVLRAAADLCVGRAEELDKWRRPSADKKAAAYRLMAKEILSLEGKVNV